MTRCDISAFLLSNMMYLIKLKLVTRGPGDKCFMDLNLGLVVGICQESFCIHENMKSITKCDYLALTRSEKFPEMYFNRPKGKHDQFQDSCKHQMISRLTELA